MPNAFKTSITSLLMGIIHSYELMGELEELRFRCRVWAHDEFAVKIGLDRHGTNDLH
jgi:hypothetical protein